MGKIALSPLRCGLGWMARSFSLPLPAVPARGSHSSGTVLPRHPLPFCGTDLVARVTSPIRTAAVCSGGQRVLVAQVPTQPKRSSRCCSGGCAGDLTVLALFDSCIHSQADACLQRKKDHVIKVSDVQLLCNASHSLIVSDKRVTSICHLCTKILKFSFLHTCPFVRSGRGEFRCNIQVCVLKILSGSQQAVATECRNLYNIAPAKSFLCASKLQKHLAMGDAVQRQQIRLGELRKEDVPLLPALSDVPDLKDRDKWGIMWLRLTQRQVLLRVSRAHIRPILKLLPWLPLDVLAGGVVGWI